MATLKIKQNNHCVYPCTQAQKIELIQKTIEENKGLNIVIACSKDATTIKNALQNESVTVVEDKEFVMSDKEYDMLISYDMPIKALIYPARVAKVTKKAVLLVEESDQSMLHSIEMLLGRSIRQDVIEGFGHVQEEKVTPSYPKKLSKEKIKEVAKQRYESQVKPPEEKEERKSSPTPEQWQKKKKAPNKFLGYDDNGKAKFSGKSGERNHRFDGKPKDDYAPRKIGKKINITAKKS